MLLKFFLKLNNFTYDVISLLAKISQNGVHPKHHLLNYHNFFLKNIQPREKILDLGCGSGELSFALSQKAKLVIGLDLKSKNISRARQLYSQNNLLFKVADVRRENLSTKFDAVILSNVLEHIQNRVILLKKIAHIAPKILIRTPNLNRDWLTLYKKERKVRYFLDRTHQIEYTVPELKKELSAAGFKLAKHYLRFGEIWAIAIKK